jgi:hypothetical protein
MPRIESTKTPLAGSAEYSTGTLQAGLADRITGSVFADQSGTIFIEQSGDGTSWDISTDYAILASDGKGFSEELVLPYVRVRYVNGATSQTVFRLFVRMTAQGSR